MVFKFLAFSALLALANAGGVPLGYAAPAVSYAAPAIGYHAAPVAYAAPVAKAVIAQPFSPAHYDFGYAVNDPHTGDSKTQHETRRGDVVQGSYSLVDSDGTRRIVEYTADPLNGFNAVVHKKPLHVKAVAPVATAIATPAIASYAAPAVAVGHGLGYAGGLGVAHGLGYAGGVGVAHGLGYAGALGYAGGLGYGRAILG